MGLPEHRRCARHKDNDGLCSLSTAGHAARDRLQGIHLVQVHQGWQLLSALRARAQLRLDVPAEGAGLLVRSMERAQGLGHSLRARPGR
eukprot:scaffold7808_cov887-Prasinococcus_capsulatus_cf.AAC.1